MVDTATVNAIIRSGESLFKETLKTSPDSGNGYGVALGVLVLVALYFGIDRWFERRDSRKWRDLQDKKADKRELDAAKRQAADIASREETRRIVIAEQRQNREDLKQSFSPILDSMESRLESVERKQQRHERSIFVLGHVTKTELPKEEE